MIWHEKAVNYKVADLFKLYNFGAKFVFFCEYVQSLSSFNLISKSCEFFLLHLFLEVAKLQPPLKSIDRGGPSQRKN